jgi:putative transposase
MIVEGAGNGHLQPLMDYIHLNAVRARIIQAKDGQSVLDYPWSSIAGGYALLPTKRARWLAADRGLAGVAGREVANEQRGEREPTAASFGQECRTR